MPRTALLVMDLQPAIVRRVAAPAAVLSAAQRAIGTARGAGVPVVFVRVAFRRGFPEVGEASPRFAQVRDSGMPDEDDPGLQVHEALGRRPDEPIVTKRRVSAFTGSDLEVLLRGLDVRHLVLAGVATGGVVLSTLRQAADLDFEQTVLEDACADREPEVHRVLTELVFPRQATVTTTTEWARSFG